VFFLFSYPLYCDKPDTPCPPSLFHVLPPVLALSMISRCFRFCLLQHKHLILCLLKESLTKVIARSMKLTLVQYGSRVLYLPSWCSELVCFRRQQPQPRFWVIAVVGHNRCSWGLLYTGASRVNIDSSFQFLLKVPEALSSRWV